MDQDAPRAAGRLHVIAGPMFAGKTEELLRRVGRHRLAGRRVEVVSHHLDTRPGTAQLRTHTGQTAEARMLPGAAALRGELPPHPGDLPDLLAIDEAQFFGPELPGALSPWLRAGVQVEVAGLCVTFDADPFDPLPALMAQADEVVKLTAVCAVCGRDAPFHHRTRAGGGGDLRVAAADLIGGSETYQALCRTHHPATATRT